MDKHINIILAQINPIVGDIDGNAHKILDIWEEHKDICDIVLFPELFLCGYPPEDLALNSSFITACKNKVYEICEHTKAFKSAALIPTIWQIEDRLYNAALLIENGEIKHITKKHKLPNYGVFDEIRVFDASGVPAPIKFRGINIGIMICEDAWHLDVPIALKKQGAELFIAINSSPFNIGKYNARADIAKNCVKATGLDFIYLNMVGGQDELVFDGSSFIMKNNGEIIFQAPEFDEHIFSNNDRNTIKITDNQEIIYSALKLGLKDYVYKNGFDSVILGLSGGIDSAIVAAIAVDALGAQHVRCVMMPSKFTSQESLDDAQSCADMLNVSCETIPIERAVSAFEQLIPDLKNLAHENIQSRIRGNMLMALSNISGEMLLTTGNKSEIAVGYCTIYGDMNGGFNPIKDLYKTEIYELARWRGLPENIINKAPTAELRRDQKDQDSLPPYEILDEILKHLMEFDHLPQDTDIANKYPDEVKQVAHLLRISEHKRNQAAPGTKVTHKSFGRDRRYPITNHFTNKIEKT